MDDKQIGQELRFLAVIASQDSEGIVAVDLNGVIRFVNPAWAMMHGYKSTDELVGEHISIFHTKEAMKTLVADFFEEAKRRGQLAGPVQHVRSDGTVFAAQTKMVTVMAEEGKAIGLVVFASDERLKGQISEREGQEQLLKHQVAELTAANEKLAHQITEYAQAEDKLKERNNQLEQQAAESASISERLEQALAKAKAATADAVAENKANAKEESKAFTSQIAQLKTELTEKERAYKEAIEKLKLQTEENRRSCEKETQEIKAETQRAIAKIKAEYAGQIAELARANEQLQDQITKYNQEHKALQEDRNQLEQHLKEQIAKLRAADEQLQHEITQREQAEEQLVSVQSRLDNINRIVHKHI